jgi:hypothetical protein
VTQREDVVGLDSSIIHNPTTWKSSGTWRDKKSYLARRCDKTFSANLTSASFVMLFPYRRSSWWFLRSHGWL